MKKEKEWFNLDSLFIKHNIEDIKKIRINF